MHGSVNDTMLDPDTAADPAAGDIVRSIALHGRVAIITGAAGGFGSAITRTLAGAGARIVLVGRDAARLEVLRSSLGDDRASVVAGDLSVVDEGDRIVERSSALWGPPDILVNCTGGATVGGLMSVEDATWRADIDGKLLAYVRMMRACARAMGPRRRGRIINVIGLAGHEPYHLLTVPSAINAALLALTKTVADELAPDGILVNAVNPNAADTELGDRMIANLAAAQHAAPSQVREYLVGATPLARLARPADVANAVLFYASGLSSFLTGTSLTVDGGAHRAIA